MRHLAIWAAAALLAYGCTDRSQDPQPARADKQAPAQDDSPFTPFGLVDQADPAHLEIPRQGAAQPLVVIIQAGAYECPHTRGFEQFLVKLVDSTPQVARFFLHNPLPGQKQGYLLAIAASAAQRQGRFWELHRELMKLEGNIDEDLLLALARRTGLDVPLFLKDMKRPELKEHVERNKLLTAALGLSGTPVFIINGRLVLGRTKAEVFAGLLDTELEAARNMSAKSPNLRELHLAIAAAYEPYHTVMQSGVKWDKTRASDALPAPVRMKVTTGFGLVSMGPAAAPVRISAYLDLECPHSAKAWKQLQELPLKYGDDLRVDCYFNPSERSPQAMAATRTALAAAKAGKAAAFVTAFFESHNLEAASGAACGSAGCGPADEHKFSQLLERVKGDVHRYGAVGTPTYFINGLKHVGLLPVAKLTGLLDRELKIAMLLVDKGLERKAVHDFVTGRGHVIPLLSGSSHPEPPPDGLRIGPADAPEKIVVFYDYASAFSHNLWPHLYRLMDRGEPGATIHLRPVSFADDSNSLAPIAAVICAAAQGRLDAYHRKLITTSNWPAPELIATAEADGMDVQQFLQCLASPATRSTMDSYRRLARQWQVKAVPTLFINGRNHTPPTGIDYYSILAAVQSDCHFAIPN